MNPLFIPGKIGLISHVILTLESLVPLSHLQNLFEEHLDKPFECESSIKEGEYITLFVDESAIAKIAANQNGKFYLCNKDTKKSVNVKCYYNRNLKMSPEKLASQIGHAVSRLKLLEPPAKIVTLKASETKFNEIINKLVELGTNHYVHADAGITEVESGTRTVVAYIDSN